MSTINLRDDEAVGEALLPWLHSKLPGAEISLPTPRKPDIGGSSEIFLVNPLIRQNGTEYEAHWVLRIEASGYQVYRDPGVDRQFRVMEILHDRGEVPVPRPLWYEAELAVLGSPFYLMERVDGQALPIMHHKEGLAAESTPAARQAMWVSAVETLAKIHCVSDERLNFLSRPALGNTGLDQEIAYWFDYMRWTGAEIWPEQDRAFDWMAAHMPAHRPTGLAWGDARPGNMIYQSNKVQAVIDWETVSLGGAETDLGWWQFYEWNFSDGMGIARLEGWGKREETIELWESFTGRKAQAMEWHEIFATLRFSLICGRARLLAERIGKPEAVPAELRGIMAARLVELMAG